MGLLPSVLEYIQQPEITGLRTPRLEIISHLVPPLHIMVETAEWDFIFSLTEKK